MGENIENIANSGDTLKIKRVSISDELKQLIAQCENLEYAHIGYGVVVHCDSGRVYGTAQYEKQRRNALGA